MKIYEEKNLRNFEFWSGGKDRAKNLTSEQLDQIEDVLTDIYPDGMEDTQINDLFWFEFDTVANWLGYESEEKFDFVNEFESEERTIEIDGTEYVLEISHDENSTTISDDITTEEMEVESGESVTDAINRYKKQLCELVEIDYEEE